MVYNGIIYGQSRSKEATWHNKNQEIKAHDQEHWKRDEEISLNDNTTVKLFKLYKLKERKSLDKEKQKMEEKQPNNWKENRRKAIECTLNETKR